MKYYKHVLALLALLVFFSTSIIAQEEEISTDEWEAEIARLTQEKADLTKELEGLQAEVNAMTEKKNSLQAFEDCQNEMYALVGTDADGVADYSAKVNALMADISAKKAEKADRQAELDALKASKLSALPAFYSLVHGKLQKMLDAWQEAPKEIMYEVVRGDHLWGIAKKDVHYGNGFAWPMIYNANRDQIKNPDLIYPAQVFKIPNLTDEETEKYSKIKANYKPAPME
jgi:uncharacterized protein YoxC